MPGERLNSYQREPKYIHSEDVKEYLIGRLGIPQECVKIKTSEKDDIEGMDLLAEDCRVEWIITKAALQEGWDCPFAYILVSLNNTQSKLSMTQLVGRVLRQPYVKKTLFPELNESYVYCLRQQAAEVVKDVRSALHHEGYEGDMASVVDRSEEGEDVTGTRTATMRLEFSRQYRTPFEGRIFLPRFCMKNGNDYETLDYFRHLLRGVEVRKFHYDEIGEWDLSSELKSANEQFYRIQLNENALEPIDFYQQQSLALDDDAHTRAWLVANLAIDWFSAKQLRYIVDQVCERLIGVEGQLALVRFRILEKIFGFLQKETDLQTCLLFKELHDSEKLFFYLDCLECRFELLPSVERRKIKALVHKNNSGLQKSLFDFQPDEDNGYEKDVALYLDRHPEVLWWYRNIVGADEFKIQGYRRSPIYPDFVVQQGNEGMAIPKVLVVESKGKHLKGNLDTEYKRDIARHFEEIGRQVSWQELTWHELGEGFHEHCFRFQILDQGDYADQDWRDQLNTLLKSE